jgi:hypothetical protein
MLFRMMLVNSPASGVDRRKCDQSHEDDTGQSEVIDATVSSLSPGIQSTQCYKWRDKARVEQIDSETKRRHGRTRG